jgi:hypothetical protein
MLTCNFAHVSQLASPMLPAFGPLKHEPTISHSTRLSVMAVIRRRVNGLPAFERPSHVCPTTICGFLLTAGMFASFKKPAVDLWASLNAPLPDAIDRRSVLKTCDRPLRPSLNQRYR